MLSQAKKDIPRGMFAAMVSLFVTAICVVFTCGTQYPGTAGLPDAFLPLSYGFSKMFNISMSQAMWLSFPALYGNFYGFVWAYGRQLSSMAKSGLMPEFVGWMTKKTDTPWVALLLGMLLSYVLALFSFYEVFYIDFGTDVKHMYMLSSYVIYIFMFVSYIIFCQKYSSLARSYVSPLGIYGGYVGLIIFVLNIICILIEYSSDEIPLYFLAFLSVAIAIYYFVILQGKQQFSEEEKQQLFKAYLINANVKSRQKVRRKAQARRGAAHSGAGSSAAGSSLGGSSIGGSTSMDGSNNGAGLLGSNSRHKSEDEGILDRVSNPSPHLLMEEILEHDDDHQDQEDDIEKMKFHSTFQEESLKEMQQNPNKTAAAAGTFPSNKKKKHEVQVSPLLNPQEQVKEDMVLSTEYTNFSPLTMLGHGHNVVVPLPAEVMVVSITPKEERDIEQGAYEIISK